MTFRKSSSPDLDTRFQVPTEQMVNQRFEDHERIGVALGAIANAIEACQLMRPAEDVKDVPDWVRERINDYTEGGLVDALRMVTAAHDRQVSVLRNWTFAREAYFRSRLEDAECAASDAEKA